MEFLRQWVESGQIIDIALGFIVLESILVLAVNRRTGGAISLRNWMLLLAHGIFVFLALKAVLADWHWLWVPIFLLCSLAAHLGEVANRWQPAKSRNTGRF